MKLRNELLLGQIALDWGLVSPDQLNAILDEQSKLKAPKPVGVLLVARGLLTDEQLVKIIDEQRRRMGKPPDYGGVRREDSLFGRLVVKLGYATEEQVNECLRAQQDLAEAGVTKRLGEIMMDCGRLGAEAILQIVEAQGKKIMVCPGCLARYNVSGWEPHRKFPCKQCGQALELELGTIHVDDSFWSLPAIGEQGR